MMTGVHHLLVSFHHRLMLMLGCIQLKSTQWKVFLAGDGWMLDVAWRCDNLKTDLNPDCNLTTRVLSHHRLNVEHGTRGYIIYSPAFISQWMHASPCVVSSQAGGDQIRMTMHNFPQSRDLDDNMSPWLVTIYPPVHVGWSRNCPLVTTGPVTE